MTTWLQKNVRLETALAVAILAFQMINFWLGQNYTVAALSRDVVRIERTLENTLTKDTANERFNSLQRQLDDLKNALDQHREETQRGNK